MSRTVWKFCLGEPMVTMTRPPQQLMVPTGAEIVHVGMQRNEVCMWAVVNPLRPNVPVTYIIAGTGKEVPDRSRHVGSVRDGVWMWHVFEVRI